MLFIFALLFFLYRVRRRSPGRLPRRSRPRPRLLSVCLRLGVGVSVRAGQEEELGAGPKCAEDGVTLLQSPGVWGG